MSNPSTNTPTIYTLAEEFCITAANVTLNSTTLQQAIAKALNILTTNTKILGEDENGHIIICVYVPTSNGNDEEKIALEIKEYFINIIGEEIVIINVDKQTNNDDSISSPASSNASNKNSLIDVLSTQAVIVLLVVGVLLLFTCIILSICIYKKQNKSVMISKRNIKEAKGNPLPHIQTVPTISMVSASDMQVPDGPQPGAGDVLSEIVGEANEPQIPNVGDDEFVIHEDETNGNVVVEAIRNENETNGYVDRNIQNNHHKESENDQKEDQEMEENEEDPEYSADSAESDAFYDEQWCDQKETSFRGIDDSTKGLD